ncbi:MAG: hypothetical protein PVSMB4_13420 [Ktedonobacterales bacterium]
MQCSVTIVVEIALEAGLEQVEDAIRAAGWQAMREAFKQAVRGYEAAHPTCPACGEARSQSQGTVARRVLTSFGQVVVPTRRQRCTSCRQRFRPAQGWVAELGGGNVTPRFGAMCALVGAGWPYATAARVLRELCGAQVSHEEVRRWTGRLGQQEAERQHLEAEYLLTPTAEQVRAERDAVARHQRLRTAADAGAEAAADAPPARLVVGLDGGWLPSRDQRGGMEGKVGVVATGVEAVGKHGRQRLTPRRYVATFGTSEQVGALAYTAAAALRGDEAGEQLVLGDGAEWIKTQAALHFPAALGVLDWAHVSRALHKAIRAARPGRAYKDLRRELHRTVPTLLWQGDVDATLAALRALRPAAPADPVPVLEDTLRYVEGQRAWLGDYAAWSAAGYPVGSGLIERAVAIVINWRMKGRGMRWRRQNASAVVALRVRTLNAGWEPHDRPPPLVA